MELHQNVTIFNAYNQYSLEKKTVLVGASWGKVYSPTLIQHLDRRNPTASYIISYTDGIRWKSMNMTQLDFASVHKMYTSMLKDVSLNLLMKTLMTMSMCHTDEPKC